MTNYRRYLDNLDIDVIKSHFATIMFLADTDQTNTITQEIKWLNNQAKEFERDYPERNTQECEQE